MTADLFVVAVALIGLTGSLALMAVQLKRVAQAWFCTALDGAADDIQ